MITLRTRDAQPEHIWQSSSEQSLFVKNSLLLNIGKALSAQSKGKKI